MHRGREKKTPFPLHPFPSPPTPLLSLHNHLQITCIPQHIANDLLLGLFVQPGARRRSFAAAASLVSNSSSNGGCSSSSSSRGVKGREVDTAVVQGPALLVSKVDDGALRVEEE